MSTRLTASRLLEMLEQVAPHADHFATAPLNCLRLESDRAQLAVLATDRYTMAVAREPMLDGAEWTVNLRLSDLDSLRAWLHRPKNHDSVTLTAYEDGSGPVLTLTQDCESISISTATNGVAKFPNWRQVMLHVLRRDVEAVPLTGFTSKYLARWQAVDSRLCAWQANAKSPLVLTDGEGFLGLQMPVLHQAETRDSLIASWEKWLVRRTAVVDGFRYSLDQVWLDRDGDPWEYAGFDDDAGEPMMRVCGLDGDEHRLSQLIAEYGPLTEGGAA
jgi:hypothetical protein